MKLRYVVLGLLAAAAVFGQGQLSSVSGTVSDPQGAVVGGVQIRLQNIGTGVETAVTSDEAGRYSILQVLPGDYKLTAEHPGFKRLTVAQFKLDINQTQVLDLRLEVGAVTESVSVAANATLVDTVSGSVGHTVSNKEILEMPISSRNTYSLVRLTPGAFLVGTNVIIAGGRGNSAGAMLDGANASSGGIAIQTVSFQPSVDAIQEFKVETNSYSAQYGRSNAGVVNAITRSGTNQFRGTLYEFLRNDKLDSRGWNAAARQPLRRNQFGGTFGGPIVKDRTFFFYNYEAYKDIRGTLRTLTLPLAEWRRGDFSNLVRQVTTPQGPVAQPLLIYDPANGQRNPFPGNVIPADRIDPVVRRVLALLPAPNRRPDNPITQEGNWQEFARTPTIIDGHTIRVDHSLNDRTKLYGRYYLNAPDQFPVGGTKGLGVADPFATTINSRRQNAVLNGNHVFSPTFILNSRFGFTRSAAFTFGPGFGGEWPKQLGLNGVGQEAFPRFLLASGLVPTTNLGRPNPHFRFYAFNNYEFSADLSKVTGKHTTKFGFQHMRYQGNDTNRITSSGQFTFQTQYTQGLNAAGAAIANTGMTFADFLLGRPTAVDIRGSDPTGRRIRYYAGYVEDEWRVTRKLTLTFGLRYELETPFFEVNGRLNNFDQLTPNPLAGQRGIRAGQTGVVTFPNRNGEGQYLLNFDRNNFGPRFGFAYKPFGGNNTVVRGGFGVIYGNPYDRQVIQTTRAGVEAQSRISFPVPFTLGQGVPAGALQLPAPADLVPEFGSLGTRWETSTIQFFDRNRKTQYSLQYNLTLQHQWKGVLFEGSYAANLTRQGNGDTQNINWIPTELLARTEIPERDRRPFTQFQGARANVEMQAPNWGISNYHALMLKSEKRFSNGISWLATYVWSKWIDNYPFHNAATGLGDNDGIQDYYNRRNERALSAGHIAHRAVVGPVWDLPVGNGKRWMNRKGPADWFLGGWQISTIATFNTGPAFGITVANGTQRLGDPAAGRVLRADLVGDPNLANGAQGTPAAGQRGIQWFNPAAFALPAPNTLGNSARAVMTGPGNVVFDTGLFKNFVFKERYRLQFRWEAFNALNTPQFGLPGSVLGTGTFGVAEAGNSKREMQLAAKLYF